MPAKKKPVVEVADSEYQPTKAELEEDVSIDASPEDLLKAVVQDVQIKITKKKRDSSK